MSMIEQIDADVYFKNAHVKIAQSIPDISMLKRKLVIDTGENVIVSDKGVTGTTVIVFAGILHRVMCSYECLDAYLAYHGHSAIYLRDRPRNFYIPGLAPLAPDYPGTIQALKSILEQLETKTLLCLGTSVGGFASIRYGVALQAKRVVAISPIVNINADFRESIGDQRFEPVIKRNQQNFAPHLLNVANDVNDRAFETDIEVWFGGDMHLDAHNAHLLKPSARLSLFPVTGLSDHNSLSHFIVSGHIHRFLWRP